MRDGGAFGEIEAGGRLERGDLAHGEFGQEFGCLVGLAVDEIRRDLDLQAIDVGRCKGLHDTGVQHCCCCMEGCEGRHNCSGNC